MSKKVMISRSQRYLPRSDVDVEKLLQDNKRIVQEYQEEVARI